MDNIKMPFLNQESMRAQRVEIYLEDLKKRLKGLRLQHDEVIQNSVELLNEIDHVSSKLLLPEQQSPSVDKVPKIKQLIQEFESVKQPSRPSTVTIIDSKVNIRRILQDFEKLNQCHALKDSLVLFKRAKESFEKIDTIIGKDEKENSTSQPHIIAKSEGDDVAECSAIACRVECKGSHELHSHAIACRVECKGSHELHSHYSSCSSSVMSLDTYHSMEEIRNLGNRQISTTNSLERGYEGDNEYSDLDLLCNIQKRQKLK